MKQNTFGIVMGLALGVALYPQARLAPLNDPAAEARSGQSEIIIDALNVERDVAVWVNDVIAAHLFPKTTEKIIVSDGRNIVHVAETTARRNSWDIGDKKQVIVDSASNRVTLSPLLRYGRLINISIKQTLALTTGAGTSVPASPSRPAASSQPVTPSRPAVSPRPAASGGIEGAVGRAVASLLTDLPDGTTLAIISIASSDRDMSEFVIEELTYLIVETRKFRVVDRKSLDVIRAETDFQYSGDVDDNSAVSIGKLLGANIVVTGSISGSGSTRRLRAKALNVRTAEIVAMASEPF
jgi:TolB-like protein